MQGTKLYIEAECFSLQILWFLCASEEQRPGALDDGSWEGEVALRTAYQLDALRVHGRHAPVRAATISTASCVRDDDKQGAGSDVRPCRCLASCAGL